MSAFISLKLDNSIVTVSLPGISATLQTVFTYDTRITEDGATRITEDGETRILDGYDIGSYPEVVAIKIGKNIVDVSVP